MAPGTATPASLSTGPVFGEPAVAAVVSTLFQDGLTAEAGPSEAKDSRGGPGVPLPATHAGLTAAIAVGPPDRYTYPHQ